MLTDNIRANTSPLIVEVIGLAGSGKTTLSRALHQQNEKMLLGDYLNVRNVRYLPFLVKHGLLSLPTLLSQPWNGRWFTRREVAKIIYLTGWQHVLKLQSSHNNAVAISDQGPIYELATLHAFGPGRLQSRHYERWWARMFNQWAHTIDLVIWLDAPEEILIERIRSRDKWHPVKASHAQEMRDYLLRYQSAYEHVISELSAIRELQVLRFNTDCQALEEITSQVLHAIDPEHIFSACLVTGKDASSAECAP